MLLSLLPIMEGELSLYFCFLFVIVFSAGCGACPEGWQSRGEGKCIILIDEKRVWNDAEKFCNNQTGNLASITSEEDLLFVQNLCANETHGCWTGGQGIDTSNGYYWKWTDLEAQLNSSFFNDSVAFNCSQTCSQSPLCTLVARRGKGLEVDVCNVSRPFLCILHEASKCESKSCHREYNIILAVVSVLIFGVTCGIAVWLLLFRQIKRWRKLSSSTSVALVTQSWRVFTFNELKAATKNFSDGNKLGNDSRSGRTYKGVLEDGSVVAIKRLNTGNFKWSEGLLSQDKISRSSNEQEFLAEIGRIARYRHPNLVVVKGCCFKHGQKYIVYDFMPNGPLDRWLHNLPRGSKSLDWTTRMKVAVTLAQGIAFLHDKVMPHVVHRDIRSSNVLLDEEFRAHILGVGLAKFVPWEAVHERTTMAGTYGYLAPEFIYHNELTTKSDVYSFGVLLLELISGRIPAQAAESAEWQNIFEWATPLVQSNNLTQILDPAMGAIPDSAEIQKVVDLVYACTQHVPSMRPRMSYIVHQLHQLVSVPSEVLVGS